jgi:hypothetical protein
MKRLAILTLGIGLLTGCYKTNLTNVTDSGSPGEVTRVWSHSLLVGLIPLSEVDLQQACGDKGVWAVSTRVNGWQVLISSFTSGIYTPSTAKITCRD